VSFVQLETGKLSIEEVNSGNEKVLLDLTFLEVMIAKTAKIILILR
jgi:hypothetical protein